jgi:hypothetical protein
LPLATEPLKPPTHGLTSHHVCFGSPISHQATIQPNHQPPGLQICHLPPHQTPDPLTHRCQTTKSHRPPGARVMATRPTRHQTNCHPNTRVTWSQTCHLPPTTRSTGAKVLGCQTTKNHRPPDPPDTRVTWSQVCHLPLYHLSSGAKVPRCQGAKATTTKILDYQTPSPPTHQTTEATDPPDSQVLEPRATGLQTHH